MAIKYLDAKRIQGSSTAPATSTSVDMTISQSAGDAVWDNSDDSGGNYSKFTAANDYIEFSHNNEPGKAAMSRDFTASDWLNGALSESAWVCRFKLVMTAWDGADARWPDVTIGLTSYSRTSASTTNLWRDTSGNGVAFYAYNKNSGGTGSFRYNKAGTWGETGQAPTSSSSLADTYYIELKRDGTTLTATYWTGDYDGTQVGQHTTTVAANWGTSAGGGVLRYFSIWSWEDGSSSSASIAGNIPEIIIYNGVTEVTQDDKATLVDPYTQTESNAYTNISASQKTVTSKFAAGHSAIGKTITSVKMQLNKNASQTGTLTVGWWSSGNTNSNSPTGVFGTMSCADVTSDTDVVYEFTGTSTHVLAADDLIGINTNTGDSGDIRVLKHNTLIDSDVTYVYYNGSSWDTDNTETNYMELIGSNLPENTIFEETDTKSHWWLQGGKWKGGAWIPTLDGATADTDGVTRTQSTSGSGVGVWTTSSASTFTLDTGNQRLNGYQGSNTGVQSMYTKMPHKLSTDSWQIDWTVILDSGHNNNTAVFLTLGSFTAIGYSPSPAEGHEYLEIVANQGNTDARWHTRCRAYPTGGSLSSITYGSQGSGGQNGGTYNSSTTYFRMTGTSTTVTVQAFTDSARTTQLGSDDVLTYDGTQFGLGNSQYIGVATDDFHLNMDIKDIKVTGFVA